MRYLSLHLPFLATDRIRRRIVVDTRPETRAVVTRSSAAHQDDDRPLVTAAKSAFGLVALDHHALALGLRPGMALADARAMYPGLGVHDADPEGDIATRDALVDWCRIFTPLVAPDGDDGLMLDISGAAHLFGGEIALMDTLVKRLRSQGFISNAAVAGTPAAAWALARFGNGRRHVTEDLNKDACTKIFVPMPLAALRLDARVIAQLGQAGLHRIGDLLLRPRAPIAARFGSHIHHRLDLLLGRARDPISPRFEAPPYLVERRFADGIARHEDVEATILTLARDLCGLLARHGEGARHLDVALYRVDGIVKHLTAGTSRPLRDPHAMARLFRERIEAAGEEGLDTGYGFDVIRLAALVIERLDPTQLCWDTNDTDATALADLIDRLGARFGLNRVTRPVITDTHQTEQAAAAISSGTKIRGLPSSTRIVNDGGKALPDRPIRLFDHPEPIETIAEVPDGPPLRFRWRRVIHHIAAIEGPERIGAVWWKSGQDDASRTRDYFRAEDTNGRRFWLYREGLYRATARPRWFLHGLFA